MLEAKPNHAKRAVMVATAGLAWFGLLLQLYLVLFHSMAEPALQSVRTVLEALINYFSFFTILTNLLVAAVLTLTLTMPKSRWGSFASRPPVQTGTALYIAVVGATYSLLLRNQWNPQGTQKIADVLLHDVVPVMYVGFTLIFVPKGGLLWKHAVLWLAYPLAYMVYIVVYGAFSGWYPYYFVNPVTLGWPHALLNAGGVLIVCFGLGLLLVASGRLAALSRKP